MIRIAIFFILMSMCCGCVNRQHAADSVAGIKAAQALAENGRGDEAKAVLDAAIAYQLGAIDLPMAELPKPTISPAAIAKQPEEYATNAPPEPKPWGAGLIAGLVTAGGAALFMVRKVAPMVPGLGPAVGGIADLAWSLLSHDQQRKADAAAASVVSAAQQAKPVLELVMSNYQAMPPAIREAVTPERLAAIAAMVSVLSSQKESRT